MGANIDIFAHSIEGADEADWETLATHLTAVGNTASVFASAFGASTAAQAMGLLHDIGKCSRAYQAYIREPRAAGGPKGPDHSSAGAREACATYGPTVGKLMAFGLAGHHAGLMDGSGHDGGTLARRLSKPVEPYDGWRDHAIGLPGLDELKAVFHPPKLNGIAPGFEMAFLARMLFSCLVDADFLETERFYSSARGDDAPRRGGSVGSHHLDAVRRFMEERRKDDTPVNRLRSTVLDHANSKAKLPPGLFTLTVPTGGGKTLTSLSFALEHALAHDLRRIVYVIPFTSIIEQTAQVFREALQTEDDILEHHSSFDWDREKPRSDDAEGEGPAGLAKLRRDAENWDAPIVVTTAVQFFESLFAARTSQARKLHNLAKSVIVLDEVQSIPVKLLRPCVATIDELARNYGASVVLCTATQPALRRQDDALPRSATGEVEALDIPDERELAPAPEDLYEKLKRVNVEWRLNPVRDEEIAARFGEQPQMLCIVNSRAHARNLFAMLREQKQAGAVHLSTLMCARHRRAVLARVRDDLKAGRPVRLVSTSLIEAGVDVSFPEVWRAAAGLSSIAQAAGRCNRSSELGELGQAFGRAVVFESVENKVPPMVEAFYGPARQVLRREDGDVLGLGAIADYYKELYFQQGYAALDNASLDGAAFQVVKETCDQARTFNFPFGRIARAFRMIDDVMDPVIVPWEEDGDEVSTVISQMRHADFPPAGTQRKLQQYVVPVPARVRSAMLASGAVQVVRPDDYGDRFVVLESLSLYDPELGLRLDDPMWRSSESNIFS